MIESSAVFSPCGQYRYSLTRWWDMFDARRLVFIGLNPSTANATDNDPTIRRCIGFAKREGFGGMVMLNLFAYVSPYPDEMMAQEDPVGPENDRTILEYCRGDNKVVACWGHWPSGIRVKAVSDMIEAPIFCLGMTKAGQPRHPLYLKSTEQLKTYREWRR